MVGYIKNRHIPAQEVKDAVRDHPLGPWFAQTTTQTDDGKIAYRHTWMIASLIKDIGAAATVHDEGPVEKNGLTKAEADFVGRFQFRDRDGVIGLMKGDGWSRRRIQKELVSLLRLLISLDPDYLARFDVAIVADDLDDVDCGRREVGEVVREKLTSMSNVSEEGASFRHGLALGLRLAGADDETVRNIRGSVDADLGLGASDQRTY